MKKKIAITLQNFVQFYSVKPFLDLREYDIDIYVPDGDKYNLGVKSMHDDIYNFLIKNKYRVYRKVRYNVKYQILLEPYPMDIYFKFSYQYRIKYKYASISAKPKITYNIPECILYDAVFCHSTYEQEVMDCFTKTFLVGRLCFNDFKRNNSNNKKKVILYLPTYGDYNYIDDVVEELTRLSTKYDIITKEHHGTNYLYSEDEKSAKLKSAINKFYDSTYSLTRLLEIADVVLTDNSGSIFEAFYTKVPVCIFSKNIEKCNFNSLESLQYQLVNEDVIPFTDDACKIESIVNQALTSKYIKKQECISSELFPVNSGDSLKTFTDAIDCFLDDDDRNLKNRVILHREIKNYLYSIVDEKEKLINDNQRINELLSKEQIEKQIISAELDEYKNGKLYRFATSIYSFMSKFRRKK